MNDIHIDLASDAIEALVMGTELVLDVPGADVRLFVRCDDAAVSSIKEQIERALLRLLPVDKSIH